MCGHAVNNGGMNPYGGREAVPKWWSCCWAWMRSRWELSGGASGGASGDASGVYTCREVSNQGRLHGGWYMMQGTVLLAGVVD